MANAQIMIKKIDALAELRGISRNQLLISCGVKDYVGNLSKGQMPKIDTVEKIADYLEVSIDYLAGRTENPEINK
ncbi:MAG: helix-turn-helix domain-containing protein [Oscillospiraceae bacterium]|nr:helix-turn-helix domain-containing protein [Oscillospiraceae bacterium]